MMASSAAGENTNSKRFGIETIDPKLMPGPCINPVIRLLIYVYYILTAGCIYWGWNGLQEILYKAGAFENYCEKKDGVDVVYKTLYGKQYIDCAERAGGINNLYTIAYSTHFICSFLGGWLLDRFGPRVCFVSGQFFSIVAWATIFCFPRNAVLLRIAFVIVGLCCEACYIPMLSVSKYFPNGSSTVIAIMGSCRSLSFFVPTLLSWIYHTEGFKSENLYVIGLCYLLMSNVLCFVSGIFVLPKEIPVPPSERKAPREDAYQLESTADSTSIDSKKAVGTDILGSIKKGFSSPQISEFIVLTAAVCLFMPSIEFVNKSQGDLLVASGDGGDATGVFKYFNILTFVPGPFLGALMDRVGPAIVMNFLHLCAFLYYASTVFDVYAMKIVACCFYLLAGSLCISTAYCYVNTRFPSEYFGVLVTIIFGIAGLISLINIPLYNWGLSLNTLPKEQRFRPLSYIFMGYMGMAFTLSGTLIYLSVVRPKKTAKAEGDV
ncbi:major facilitator superfamily protein MFS-1 [Babesia ovis]|uniref:Major facilitator superfamily protein MFS-1 n=1 Tax=Babesia ovis TaxID=5869 RepID=A0A9W5TDK9_BABOV|nr:major facilitator superfamily protein MFS-1 [Babesia ovis]GFE56097.1 major facilitator superfamily protein MFS-1 [Babesia ovis]